jgi:hypothetical protein
MNSKAGQLTSPHPCNVTLANIGSAKVGSNYSPLGHSPKAISSPFGHPDIQAIFPPAAWSCTLQETVAEQNMEEEISL